MTPLTYLTEHMLLRMSMKIAPSHHLDVKQVRDCMLRLCLDYASYAQTMLNLCITSAHEKNPAGWPG
jgi:hypothetical protein